MCNQPQTFSILFRVAKARTKNGKAPISVRITVNGQRAEISTHRSVSPFEWDAKNQLCTAKGADARELNNLLAVIKGKLVGCYGRLLATQEYITAEAIKQAYTGVVEKPRMLLEIIIQHNKDIAALIGQEYSRATWVKYETTRKHIKDFLLYKGFVNFGKLCIAVAYIKVFINARHQEMCKRIEQMN